MGHADIQTTARYLHAKSQADDAALLAGAFTGPARGAGRRLARVGSESVSVQATYDREADIAWFRLPRFDAGSARTDRAEWGLRDIDEATGATVGLQF
ncbi:MAG: hypothetical protein WKF96_23960 [Solirubrobacteraceae bacterium]